MLSHNCIWLLIWAAIGGGPLLLILMGAWVAMRSGAGAGVVCATYLLSAIAWFWFCRPAINDTSHVPGIGRALLGWDVGAFGMSVLGCVFIHAFGRRKPRSRCGFEV